MGDVGWTREWVAAIDTDTVEGSVLLPPPMLIEVVGTVSMVADYRVADIANAPFLFVLTGTTNDEFFYTIACVPQRKPAVRRTVSTEAPDGDDTRVAQAIRSVSNTA